MRHIRIEFVEVPGTPGTPGTQLMVASASKQGLAFAEDDPLMRPFAITFKADNYRTSMALEMRRRMHGWAFGTFELSVGVEDGCLVLSGDFPDGIYRVGVTVAEAQTNPMVVEVKGHRAEARRSDARCQIVFDRRTVVVDVDRVRSEVLNVLKRSVIHGVPGTDWVRGRARAAARACLMNVLAKAAVTGVLPFVGKVLDVKVDRIYVSTSGDLFWYLNASPERFMLEGYPKAAVHQAVKGYVDRDHGSPIYGDLRSYRSIEDILEPSLQVVTLGPVSAKTTAAELDIDLGNPLQDLQGFVVHVGELLNTRPTNHLDLYGDMARPTRDTAAWMTGAFGRAALHRAS